MQKLLNELERDIRNQVRFNNMLRLNRRQRIMVQFQRAARFNTVLALGALLCAIFWIVLCMTIVHAEDAPKPACPTAGERCKILYLSEQEERMLMGQNGILDTAAQARAIDLGQFSVYLKTRIAGAPAGEVKAVEKPVTEEMHGTKTGMNPTVLDNPK